MEIERVDECALFVFFLLAPIDDVKPRKISRVTFNGWFVKQQAANLSNVGGVSLSLRHQADLESSTSKKAGPGATDFSSTLSMKKNIFDKEKLIRSKIAGKSRETKRSALEPIHHRRRQLLAESEKEH